MYKALCAAIVLMATFAPAQDSKPACNTPTPFPSPLIVAKGKLINQTAPIPTTTIFKPTQSGLYRLSVYGTLTTAAVSSSSDWFVNLFWTDDSGMAQSVPGLLAAAGNQPGQFVEFEWAVQTNGGAVSVFEAKAGTPITYSVTQSYSDGSSYSLYYTLERLE